MPFEQRISNLEEKYMELLGKKAPLESNQLDPYPKLILSRNILKPISGIVFGTNAATATNYGTFFISDRSYYVMAISENHRVIGSDGSPVTVTVEKCATGVAPDSGVVLLTTAFSLKATVDTPQFGTLTATIPDLILTKGDRLVLKDAGVLTAVSDVCVTVLLREF